ncbi:hypothetical protein EDB81DRAFT_834610 [Dactylonectria macrodidyma]|uniref:Uncharacterized protein n=1 Tax=Dactylonectria macrodidyma TaxID=307937 RepID=A0A9P9CY07_9HYPO|nr:hypothetical protein EDB81DRAFT_834610 [Dactylonectria macrodidyma]
MSSCDGDGNLRLQNRVSIMTTARFASNSTVGSPGSPRDDAHSARRDSGYNDRFVKAVRTVLKEQEEACRNASNAFWDNCGLLAVNILQSPIYWIHKADPFVACGSVRYVERGNAKSGYGRRCRR